MEIKLTTMAVEKLVIESVDVVEFILTKEEGLALARLIGQSTRDKRVGISRAYDAVDDGFLLDAWQALDIYFDEKVGFNAIYDRDRIQND